MRSTSYQWLHMVKVDGRFPTHPAVATEVVPPGLKRRRRGVTNSALLQGVAVQVLSSGVLALPLRVRLTPRLSCC